MTAEIAILNRTAVALAADSVVTLSSPLGSKTYDSVEKIFELTRFSPVGLMIYNHVEFSRIPLEILARKFREVVSDEFTSLIDVWPRFRKFLFNEPCEFNDSTAQFEALIVEELERLKMVVLNAVIKGVAMDDKSSRPNPEQVLLRAMDEATAIASADRLDGFLDAVSLDEFADSYGDATDKIVEANLAPFIQQLTGVSLGEEPKSKFMELAFTLVRSKRKSPAFTGLVFAGFGRDEIFPSLHWVEIDGVYFDQLREIDEQNVDIDRHGETAAIVPFAQTDMPERFIYGIDQDFEEKLKTIAADLATQVMEQAPDSFDQNRRVAINDAAVSRFMQSVSLQKNKSSAELYSVVNHLSKKELGEVAYSLVELTSRKRRYSSEMETVGGPIDVAILTRNEGLVWVRRKHYFDAHLNPGYFERVKNKWLTLRGDL